MRIFLLGFLLAGGSPAISLPLTGGVSGASVLLAIQQATPVRPGPQAMEPLAGTLEIDAASFDDVEFQYLPVARPYAGWIFINGELRRKMPFKQRWNLAPGAYDVKAVLAAKAHGIIQFWTVRWPRVVVTSGATSTLKTDEAIRRFPRVVSPDDEQYSASPEPTMEKPVVELTESRVAYFEKAVWDEFDQKWKAYKRSSPLTEVEDASNRILREPPSRPVIWIDMPMMLGGPREFDIDQLRVLQEYSRPNIGGWGTAIPLMPAQLTPQSREFMLKTMDELRKANGTLVDYVDVLFDVIIAALEKARTR